MKIRIELSDEAAPLAVHLTNAAAAGFVHVLESKVNLRKEEATEWSGLQDKLDMKLRLLRAPRGEVVSETRLEGQSKLMSWGGDRVELLVQGIGAKWVGALYGHSEFRQTQTKADAAEKQSTIATHTMLVTRPRDLSAGNLSVRLHSKGNTGAKPKAEVVADILAAIRERRS